MEAFLEIPEMKPYNEIDINSFRENQKDIIRVCLANIEQCYSIFVSNSTELTEIQRRRLEEIELSTIATQDTEYIDEHVFENIDNMIFWNMSEHLRELSETYNNLLDKKDKINDWYNSIVVENFKYIIEETEMLMEASKQYL